VKREIHGGNTDATTKTAITKSVAETTIGAFLQFCKQYNLYFREINRELIETSNAPRKKARDKSDPDSYKVRKAKVGGYRDYFDADQIA